jgi:hypothetical protein
MSTEVSMTVDFHKMGVVVRIIKRDFASADNIRYDDTKLSNTIFWVTNRERIKSVTGSYF